MEVKTALSKEDFMAVKIDLSKEDFIVILSNYNLGEYKRFKRFKLGSVQTNLLLETTSGKFVFKYYKNRLEKYVLFELNTLNHLGKYDYPCPEPIRNIHGEVLGKYKNKPFAIFEFMGGEHRKNMNSKLTAEAIGRLHKITIGYKPQYREYRDKYDPSLCIKYAKSNSKNIKSKSEFKKRLVWLKRELEKLEIPGNLPKGVCHCDLHPSNFLYENDKISAVLDFDDASYICLLYDVADMIYFWAWPHKKDLPFGKAKELLKEYSKYRKITEAEKKHLYDLLKMVIFMSVGWFIHKDDYYSEKRKIEFLDSIGRKEFYNKMFN